MDHSPQGKERFRAACSYWTIVLRDSSLKRGLFIKRDRKSQILQPEFLPKTNAGPSKEKFFFLFILAHTL